jgi:hypothetical protein
VSIVTSLLKRRIVHSYVTLSCWLRVEQRFITFMSIVDSNELAHIQRPPKTARSPPSAYPTLASHPTLRRALLLKGALGRRTDTALLDKPSRQALLHRKSRALQEDGVLDLNNVDPHFGLHWPLSTPAVGAAEAQRALMG